MATLTAQSQLSALRAELCAAGCFDYAPWRSITSLILHLALAVVLWLAAGQLSFLAAAPVFVLASLFFYRIGWLMHDAAHNGVFESAENNRRFTALTAGILGEFPSGWRYGHNKHHGAPNVVGRDMDQSERWDPQRRYSSVWTAFIGIVLLTQYKGRYLPKTVLLLGLRDGYFCFKQSRQSFARELATTVVSLALQISFFVWLFRGWGVLFFLAHTSIGMLYLNTVFMGNHYDLEFFEQDEAEKLEFVELQVRTVRNYAGAAGSRYIFGGLEHQIEHHIFPAMPRHQLVKAEPFVRQFCKTTGLPYQVRPFAQCIARAVRFHTTDPC